MSQLNVWRITIVTLWVATLLSALGVVYVKHRARTVFHQLQQLSLERDELDIEWGRLRLEQSTWATQGRIEQLARSELSMRTPEPKDIVVIKQ